MKFHQATVSDAPVNRAPQPLPSEQAVLSVSDGRGEIVPDPVRQNRAKTPLVIDLDEIERLAKAATAGEWWRGRWIYNRGRWVTEDDDSQISTLDRSRALVVNGEEDEWGNAVSDDDLAYFVGTQPRVVLALVDMIRRLQKESAT